MEQTTQPREFMTDRWAKSICAGIQSARCGIGAWRRRQARESLEADLARIIETAIGHREKGVARGSEVFINLNKKADEKIVAFASKWSVLESDIRDQAPALRELHALTIPSKGMSPLKKLLAVFMLLVVGIFATGFATGVIHNIFERSYNTGNRLLVHR